MSSISDVIRQHVDVILCLTCPQSIRTRFPSLVAEFSRYGLGDLLLPFPNVHSIIEHAELDRRVFANDGARKTNVKNCTLGHYHMAKFGLDAGYESVMLIEDDCRFAPDAELISRYFDDLPKGSNAILSYRGFPQDVFRGMFMSNGWRRWARIPKRSFFDLATCYILGRDGLESLVRHYETAGTPESVYRVDACDRAWPYLTHAVDVYLPRVNLFVPSGSESVTNGLDV